MTLLQRFSLVNLLIMVILGSIFGHIVTFSMELNMLQRSREITAAFVHSEIIKEFDPNEILSPASGDYYEKLSSKVRHLNLGADVVRIKIWNYDMAVVWSDDRSLIGRKFSNNEELAQALNGKIVSDISSLEKYHEDSSQKHQRFMELYIPVRFPGENEIGTVFELYKNLDSLYLDITYHKRMVWIWIIGGFSFLYMVLFGIVWNASKQLEKQNRNLIQSEEQYRSLVESAQDGIISIDRFGKVVLFNKAAQRIFGYAANEIIGHDVMILLPEKYRQAHATGMTRYFDTLETAIIGQQVEYEGLRKSGEIFPMELSLSCSRESDNTIVTGIIRDISERRAIQAQLIEAEKQSTVSIISGSIGHELNNAISGLMGYSELLMMRPDDSEVAKKCAEIVSSQSQRLKMHAHNLLSLSKPREPEMKAVNINHVIARVTELLFESGVLKLFTISKNIDSALPPVLGDEILLEQVIRNLEINAAHAMGHRGILTLGTMISKDGGHVEFSVSDTGHGIPNDKRSQIFLPFYTTKEKGKGTGLGMYIVKQIVDQHKGYIEIDSIEGKGTTVMIGIPII